MEKPLFCQKNASFCSDLTQVFNAAEGVPGGAVYDQNKPVQNRLPALICNEQELTWNGEELPETLFT